MATAITNQVVVYRVRNLLDGKHYVGVTRRGLGRREHEHRYEAKLGKTTSLLHRAMRKYGAENFVFETVFDFEGDYELAMIYEGELVEKEKPAYNLVPGGLNKVGPTHPETRARMRESHLGIANVMKGKKRPPGYISPRLGMKASPETIVKMRAHAKKKWPPKPEPTPEETAARRAEMFRRNREARKGVPGHMTGKKHTPEALAKMRAAHLGKPGPWAGKKRPEVKSWLKGFEKGVPAWNKGVPMRDESRQKLSAKLKGRAPPPASLLMTETRVANMRKAAAERRVKVICLNDGTVYVGLQAVADAYGLSEGSVLRLIRLNRASRKGLRFAYEARKLP